jgi:NADH-quinone oxidoreductase subunit L
MTMIIPLGVLSLGAIFAGMVWFNSFFGHTDTVAKFYGIPYAEAGAHDEAHAEGHSDDTHATHVADGTAEEHHGDKADEAHADAATAGDHGGEKEHHHAFTGVPGEGALHMAPDNTVLDNAHKVPKWVKLSPFVAMLGGFLMAMWFYIWNPSLPVKLAENQRPLYLFLKNKWYFDEIYDFIFVKPAMGVGRLLWKRGDGDVIDGSLNGVAMGIIPFFTRLAGRAQSGYIFTYAFWMVIGIAFFVTWMTMSGGAN